MQWPLATPPYWEPISSTGSAATVHRPELKSCTSFRLPAVNAAPRGVASDHSFAVLYFTFLYFTFLFHACGGADACQHKLQSLGKYITDVEAFVNIHMDAVRNRMIKFEILLMVGTFALGVFAVIAGILGENIPIAPHSLVTGEDGFVLVNILVSLMCMAIFVSIMVCARRNGLM